MKKDDLKDPIAVFLLILFIAMIVLFSFYYFISPIKKEKIKTELSFDEQLELTIMTEAYLNQNIYINADQGIIEDTALASNPFGVAAEYMYLKDNTVDLSDLESIKKVAEEIFNSKLISFNNFEINIDSSRCGKQKYSTIEGIINSDECDNSTNIYEIKNSYFSEEYYIVEAYASNAKRTFLDLVVPCEEFEKGYSYRISLTDYSKEEYYGKKYEKCCSSNCNLEDIYTTKDELINQMKINKKTYKFYFKKIGDRFVYDKIKK